jgi:hypothetical protein
MHKREKRFWVFVAVWLVALAAVVVAIDRRFSEATYVAVERGQQ